MSEPVEAVAADAPAAEPVAPDTSAVPAPEAAQPAAAARPPAVVSAIAKAEREKRAALKRVRELEAKPTSNGPSIAELKARYEADPDAFLQEIAGEDFYGLAQRIAARAAPPTAEEAIKAINKRTAKLEAQAATEEAERSRVSREAADARTKAALAEVSTLMLSKDGEAYKYPTLATLDPDLGETPEETAFDAVVHAWQTEGKPKWTEAEQAERLHDAFAALDAHYAKFRQPKERNSKPTVTAEETSPSPTITQSLSPGRQPAAKAPPRGESQEAAIRRLMKEAGLQADI